MAYPIAVCDECGMVFETKQFGRIGEGVTTFHAFEVCLCPGCGGAGSMVDVAWMVALWETQEALAAGMIGQRQINQVVAMLRTASAKKEELDEIAEWIETKLPALKQWADVIRTIKANTSATVKSETEGDRWEMISIIIAMLVSFCD